MSDNQCRRPAHDVGLRSFGNRLALVVLSVPLLLLAGCRPEAAEESVSETRAHVTDVDLPEFAPEDPSPEFLRAAEVLKPLPEEEGRPGPQLTVAMYEMFGELSDDQIATLLNPKEEKLPADAPDDIRALFREHYGARDVDGELVVSMSGIHIPFKDLTPAQLEAFENMEDAWSAYLEACGDAEDLLVKLSKWGAKEDLSNVSVGFRVVGHEVFVGLVISSGGDLVKFGRSFAKI